MKVQILNAKGIEDRACLCSFAYFMANYCGNTYATILSERFVGWSRLNNVILLFGLPGAGKSTVARLLAKELSQPLISTEEIRAQLFGEGYIEEDRDLTLPELVVTYNAVEMLLEIYIRFGKLPIVDGVFRRATDRVRLTELLAEKGVGLSSYYLLCDDQTAKLRLGARKEEGTNSPAGYETFCRLRNIFEYDQTSMSIDTSDVGAGELAQIILQQVLKETM